MKNTTVKNINGLELTMESLLVRIKNNWLLKDVTGESDIQILGNAVAKSNKEGGLEGGLAMDIVQFICYNPHLVQKSNK